MSTDPKEYEATIQVAGIQRKPKEHPFPIYIMVHGMWPEGHPNAERAKWIVNRINEQFGKGPIR